MQSEKIAVQISPEAKSAYFSDYVQVSKQELHHVLGDVPVEYQEHGPLRFFVLHAKAEEMEKLLRLSFVQGVYLLEQDLLRPQSMQAQFCLHEDFVFGSKYKGKTNERLTQMLINVGLASAGILPGPGVSLLDPMCGRGTTLLWAMRYGIKARGIEPDTKVLVHFHRELKKWCKLHRQKHKIFEGVIHYSEDKNSGKFLDFSAEQNSMRVVVGDGRSADQIFKKEKFDLLICDLPYGVQHSTNEQARDPLGLVRQCVVPWKNCLKKSGVIVLSFNSNNPKREALLEAFEKEGLKAQSFSAKHRMSESIVRDVVVLKL